MNQNVDNRVLNDLILSYTEVEFIHYLILGSKRKHCCDFGFANLTLVLSGY